MNFSEYKKCPHFCKCVKYLTICVQEWICPLGLSITTLTQLLAEMGSHLYLELIFERIPAAELKALVREDRSTGACMCVSYMYVWTCKFGFFPDFGIMTTNR